MSTRHSLIVAANFDDADYIRDHFEQFCLHLALTPEYTPSGFLVSDYVWTPRASKLPARERMLLRGKIAPFLDEQSMEEEFPLTLLSW